MIYQGLLKLLGNGIRNKGKELGYIISVGLTVYVFPAVGLTLRPKAVAHSVGVVIPVFISFLGHKYLSFSSPL